MGNNVKLTAEQGHKLIKSALLKVEYELNREESAATPIFFFNKCISISNQPILCT